MFVVSDFLALLTNFFGMFDNSIFYPIVLVFSLWGTITLIRLIMEVIG